MQNRIKEIRLQKNLTQADLAARVQSTQGAIQKLESGMMDLDLKWMDRISKALNVSPSQLLPSEWLPPEPVLTVNEPGAISPYVAGDDTVAIDILDVSACCGDGSELITENVIGQQILSISTLREYSLSAPENIKIIKAIGDSMMPTINPNDIVWIDISVKTPTSDGLYLLCVGTDLIIKRIQIDPFNNSVMIKSDNPSYAPFTRPKYTDIRCVGKVIYHMKRMA